MQRPLLAALLLLSACDAAVTAEAEAPPTPVVAEAGLVADANTELAVVADTRLAANVDADADADAAAAARVEIAGDAFKLGEVTTLIKDGTIESAAELELAVNDPDAGLNRVDLDLDGQIDHVQVIEVRNDARVDFEFRVIPSSKPTIEHSFALATASVVAARATSEVSFSASFSAGVGFSAGAAAQASVYSFVAPARFEASAVFVAQPLLAWAFVVERPVYASLYVEANTGRWIPPGHLKHGLWKATGEFKGHGKFAGHGEFKGHGKFKGDAPGEFGGGGKAHGGPGKSHGPSSSGGGKHHGSSNAGGPGHGPSKSSGGHAKGGGHGGGPKGGGGGSSPKGGGHGGGKGKK